MPTCSGSTGWAPSNFIIPGWFLFGRQKSIFASFIYFFKDNYYFLIKRHNEHLLNASFHSFLCYNFRTVEEQFFFFLRLARETFPQIATFPFERRMQSGSRQNIKKQNGTSGSQTFFKTFTHYVWMYAWKREKINKKKCAASEKWKTSTYVTGDFSYVCM